MRASTMAAAILLALSSARAEEFRVKDLRAYLFLSNTGTLSENLIGAKEPLFNVVAGSEFGGPASNVLIDLTLANTDQPRPTQTATLKVSYKSMGKDMSVTRAYSNNTMASGEVVHESLLLENATCFPVIIEARVGNGPARKTKIDFGCGE